MSNVSLMPVASEPAAATCTSCGAPLVADQRYCLACGQPCSPVRLAFLDVLQERPQAGAPPPPNWPTPGTIELGPSGYLPVFEPGPNGWLRRYSGLLGLFAVLLLCLLVGLLVGHWVTQGNKTPAKQVVEVKGLTGLPASAAVSPTSAATATTPTEAKASAKEEAEESKEAAKETKAEKAPPPKPVTVTPTKLKKLTKTTGKKHQEEINALGSQPIEVR